MVEMRWSNGVACPHCGSVEHGFVKTRRIWNCKGCKKQFSVKVGTIFEDSPLPLSKWLPAIWILTATKNGTSSCELARSIGVTQKTAWFMLHRIRELLTDGMERTEKLTGTIEADETYIGGLEGNKHESKKLKSGRGNVGKVAVAGMLERGGGVRAKVVPTTSAANLQSNIRENVEAGSAIMTDAYRSYRGLDESYKHMVVDHAIEYVREHIIHTNGMENFWSLLKRTIKGTYVAVDVTHLDAYLDEQTFRFNHRGTDDSGRFLIAAKEANGKRLTYKELINKD